MLNPSSYEVENKIIPITRLTALWALSESMLGGLLHAAHVPLRGMIISSAAVIIICLIAHFSEKKGEILKATIIVLIIKGAISPHTPFAAYLAVFMQGLFGEIFFYKKRFFAFSSIILGAVIGILTGLQRFVTLTLIFGATLWDAFNQFMNYAVNEFLISSSQTNSINFSIILVSSYVLIHFIFGLAAGTFAAKLPKKIISNDAKEMLLSKINLDSAKAIAGKNQGKKKKWWKKPTYLAILIFSAIHLAISYFNPQAINLNQKSILLMLIRSFLIIIIWFFYLSPLLMSFIKKMLHKKQNAYTNEVSSIINHIPQYKNITVLIWKSSSKYKGLRRLNHFMTGLIVNVLTLEISD